MLQRSNVGVAVRTKRLHQSMPLFRIPFIISIFLYSVLPGGPLRILLFWA